MGKGTRYAWAKRAPAWEDMSNISAIIALRNFVDEGLDKMLNKSGNPQ